jgi:MSHA pilin protein MshC
MPRIPPLSSRGFTLVELIVTMVVVGLLAAIAIPRFFNRGSYDARAFLDQARSMVGYGQKLAIERHRNIYVRIDAGGVALCYTAVCGSAAELVPQPGGGNGGGSATRAYCMVSGTFDTSWFCLGKPTGVAFTKSNGLTMFYFDPLGKPYLVGDGAASSFPVLLDVSINGDGQTVHLFVEQETGYVHGT